MKDVRAFGLMFPVVHPFFGLGVAWAKVFIFLSSPCFSFLCSWASWQLILPYHFIVPAIALPLFFYISCYLVGLRANAPSVPAHFFINLLLKASLAYFPHLYLFWVLLANIPIMLAYFIFLGLSQPIYFIFTSFTLMSFLVDPLSFLSPITTSLHFITFWVIGL